MSTINQLEAVDALDGTEVLSVFDVSNGDARQATIAELMGWLEDNMEDPDRTFVDQTATVVATGWRVAIQDTGQWMWLHIIQPSVLAAGTIVFPANPVDQQEIMLTASHETTTITYDGNGATFLGGSTYDLDESISHWKYEATLNVWHSGNQ